MDKQYGSELGAEGGPCSGVVSGPYGVGLWKHITGGWGNFLDLLDLRWEIALVIAFGMIYGVGNMF